MPKRRKVNNMLGLAVLSTVSFQPMHPYEMAAVMRERGKDQDMDIKWGSLYTVVQNLEKHGFLAATESVRQGGRPERTVYRITDAGRAELQDWARELLGEPEREFPRFEAGAVGARRRSHRTRWPPCCAADWTRPGRAARRAAGRARRQRQRAADLPARGRVRPGRPPGRGGRGCAACWPSSPTARCPGLAQWRDFHAHRADPARAAGPQRTEESDTPRRRAANGPGGGAATPPPGPTTPPPTSTSGAEPSGKAAAKA